MSQSVGSPRDTQAVLQSMLQRLRLQPGAQNQGCSPSTAGPSIDTPHQGQGGGAGHPDLQAVAKSNVVRAGKRGASAALAPHRMGDADTDTGSTGLGHCAESGNADGEGQQLDHRPMSPKRQDAMTASLSLNAVSSLSRESDVDGVNGATLGQTAWPAVAPAGNGQGFPAERSKDIDPNSIVRTGDGIQDEKVRHVLSGVSEHVRTESSMVGSLATNSHNARSSLPRISPPTPQLVGQNSMAAAKASDSSGSQNHNSLDIQVQGFTPKVYAWSLKPVEAGDVGNGPKNLHQGNGAFGVSSQNPHVGGLSPGQNTANTSPGFVVKNRLSETKTKRWTQKIKERLRDRNGSFGKRGKEKGERNEQKNGSFSTANQSPVDQSVFTESNKEEDRTPHPPIRNHHDDTPPTPSENCTTDDHVRSITDLPIGLGSFSLLEEIIRGQEWATFLHPIQTYISNNHTQMDHQTSQQQTAQNFGVQDTVQSSTIKTGNGNKWTFGGTGLVSVPSDVDISETDVTPVQSSKSKAGQSEPMEYGPVQSHLGFEPSVMGGLNRTPQADFSIVKVPDHSTPVSHVQANRKRGHQRQEGTAERRDDGERGKKEAKIDESLLGTSIMQTTEEGARNKNDATIIPLYPRKSPSPSFFSLSPAALPVPGLRSALRHADPQVSESKKGRPEDSRRVHFSEEVVAIAPVELGLDGSDLEDEMLTEESITEDEEEVRMEQLTAREDAGSAVTPRPMLPAWIQALKRRKTGRKPRQ